MALIDDNSNLRKNILKFKIFVANIANLIYKLYFMINNSTTHVNYLLSKIKIMYISLAGMRLFDHYLNQRIQRSKKREKKIKVYLSS